MGKKAIRTDLALETREMIVEAADESSKIEGVEIESDKTGNISVTRVKVVNEEGEIRIGKPKGSYITIEFPKMIETELEDEENIKNVLANEIKRIVDLSDKSTVLIVGLGNENITPDALGPKVISHAVITRHLHEYMPEAVKNSKISSCAVSPGVLGITGIETVEIVKGVIEKVNPDILFVIDSLASRKMERVSTTIQIADTGITPGSGVGNSRKEFSQNSLGIPVIAIGVPTVVDAVTIVFDTIETVLSKIGSKAGIVDEEKEKIIDHVLGEEGTNIMVTPKEIDDIIKKISLLVAEGINIALHEGINPFNAANLSVARN